MKITATQLRRIISEEVSNALSEAPKKPLKHWSVSTFDDGMTRAFVLGTVEAPNEDAAISAAKKKFGKDYEIGYSEVKQVSAAAAERIAAKKMQQSRDDAEQARRGAATMRSASAPGAGLWLATIMGADPNTESYLGVVNAPDAAAAEAAATKKWGGQYTGNYGRVVKTTKSTVASMVRSGRL